MGGKKITLKNCSSTTILFSYKELSTGFWKYQATLLPGQMKTIVSVLNTFSYNTSVYNITIVSEVNI
jgi:hypothetical protein